MAEHFKSSLRSVFFVVCFFEALQYECEWFSAALVASEDPYSFPHLT